MEEKILIGRGSEISSVSRKQWEAQLSEVPSRMKVRLSFMTAEHHRVRYFVVRELPRTGEPVSPELIAERLKMSSRRVNRILRDLEDRLFFLVRDKHGRVSWAFPVTSQKTPHRLKFSTGEEVYAA